MRLRLAVIGAFLVLAGCGSESATKTDGALAAADAGPDSAVETRLTLDADNDIAAKKNPDAEKDIAATDSGNDGATGPLCQGQASPIGPHDAFGICPDSDPQMAWASVCLTCDGLRAHPECLQVCSFYSQCYRCGAYGWSFGSFGCSRSCGDGGAGPSPVDVGIDAPAAPTDAIDSHGLVDADRIPRAPDAQSPVRWDAIVDGAGTTSIDCSGIVCSAASPATARCAGARCVIDVAESPNIAQFALDDANIYWTDFGNMAVDWTDGAVMTAPRAGGKVTTLASNQLMAWAIAVDDKNVYWLGGGKDTGKGFVRSVPKAGGATTTMASGLTDLSHVAVDNSNVYWTGGDGADGRLMSMPKTGGAPTALVSGGTLIGIAVDATNVYYSSFSSFYVSKVPKAGGTSSTIGPYGNYPAPIALNDSYVFWANSNTDGSIAKVAKSGGPGTILASAQASPTSIAADAGNVYWTLSDAGTILKIPVEGGTITTVVSGQSKPACVTVDGDNLYWIGSGKSGRAILTTAK